MYSPEQTHWQVVVSFFNSPTRSLRRYSLRLPAKEIRMVSWALRSLLSVAGIEGDNWFVGDTYRCIIGGFIGIQRVLLGQSWDNHWDIMGIYLPVTWLANPQSTVFLWEIVYEGMVCHYLPCMFDHRRVCIYHIDSYWLYHCAYLIVHTQKYATDIWRPYPPMMWLWLAVVGHKTMFFQCPTTNGKRCLTHPSPKA